MGQTKTTYLMKYRRRHTWRPNKASSRPRHIIFVDTESVPIPTQDKFKQHTLKLGYACYKNYRQDFINRKPQWLYFTEVGSFWGFVEEHLSTKEKLYVIGHGTSFDMGILEMDRTAKSKGWKESFYHSKGSTLIVNYKTPRGSLCIISTTNFFPMPLKVLGTLVGMEKGEVDFDTVSDQKLKEYCQLDVKITIKAFETWIAFLDKHDLGNFQSTIASQAFAAYRHRFMHTDVWIHGDMEACLLERDAYRGGRCEVFRTGTFPEGDYYKLDVNGLYGHIMGTHKLPFNLYGHKGKVKVNFLRNKLKRYAVVAKVLVKTDYPVFPLRRNGVNCYQLGTFTTTLTTPELIFAFENCQILEVQEITWYEQAHILRDYALYFANLKDQYSKEGNAAFRKISKLFNNALYGKLAQRDYGDKRKDENGDIPKVGFGSHGNMSITKRVKRNIRNIWDKSGEVLWGNEESTSHGPNVQTSRLEKWSPLELLGKKSKVRYIEDQGIKKAGTRTIIYPKTWKHESVSKSQYGESYNSFPAIAAHVTAYARMYLWEIMVQAGRENVYYCDTDGFICNRQGYENLKPLLHSHEQGKLKVEGRGTSLTIWRRKGYMLDGERVICGIRKNAIEIATLVFEQDQFLGSAGAIREGDPDRRGITRVLKHVNTEIKGGKVGPDGWVTPFRVSM